MRAHPLAWADLLRFLEVQALRAPRPVATGRAAHKRWPRCGPTSVRNVTRATSSPLGSRMLTVTWYSVRTLVSMTGHSPYAVIVPRAFLRSVLSHAISSADPRAAC